MKLILLKVKIYEAIQNLANESRDYLLRNERDLDKGGAFILLWPIDDIYECLDATAIHVLEKEPDASLLKKGSVAA